MEAPSSFAAVPLETQVTVEPGWIDYNGHMNVAYYVLAFDRATDRMLDLLDVGEAYRRRTEASFFVLESHITYDREVVADDPLRITTQILGSDTKRLHFFHHMYHADAGYLAATTELMGLHVDLTQRRSAALPAAAAARIAALTAAHRDLPWPEKAGRRMSLDRKG